MSAQDCIALIREQAPDLTDDEITDIVEELQRRLDSRRARGELMSLEDALFDEADRLTAEVEQAAQIEKRNRLLNIVRRNNLLEAVRTADEAMDDPSLGLEGRMVGVNAPFAGSRQSVDARSKALFMEYAGGMIADLRRANLLTTFNTRRLEREIAVELEQITKPQGERGLSGSQEARQIAEIIDKYRKVNIGRQNRAGAWIKELPGYITRQTHDIARLRRASNRLGGPSTSDSDANFRAWRDFILPRLDERTFEGVDNANEFLRQAYNALVTGKHLRTEGGEDTDLLFAFKGPGNLAKRLSGHRKLHFRNADAWLEYNERFGTRSLTEAIVQDLEQGARNTALMETFGTNPRAMFDKVVDDLREQYKQAGEIRKVDRLSRRSLQWQMAEIDGSASIPGNPTLAHVGSATRAVQTLSKLGGAFLSSIGDLGFAASEIRYQGTSTLGSYGRMLTNLLDGLPTDADRRATADLIGVGLEGIIGDVAARFSAQDHTAGRISKMQQVFFKLNLLGPWTDANKRGLGLMMARDLAVKSGQGWDALDVKTRQLLGSYGLDAQRWDIARQAVRDAPDGNTYLMPDALRDLPDEAFAGVEGRSLRQLRDEIETSLRSYYVDRADFASPTPGARERALLRMGMEPGTPQGEAIRFLTQFKAFPITALTKPLGREVFGGGARTFRDALLKGQGDLLGIANMIVATTVLGYLAQSSKEIAKGRTPRDPSDPATWQAAMLQGGGLGIYGDFLLGETNRFGRSMLDTLAGPTLGTLSEVDELRAKIMAGDDAGADAVRLLMSNAPFANLFYTRAALDYLIFYQLQEAVNPGYLRRMERRIKRENNQTFMLPPSRTIPRGGGNQLLEGVR